MRKALMLGILSSVFLAGAAMAADEMKAAFGNTIEVTMADGTKSSYYINADGTYTAMENGKAVKGKWTIKNGQSCLMADGGAAEQCGAPIGAHKPGDSWENANSAGGPAKIMLKAGRAS